MTTIYQRNAIKRYQQSAKGKEAVHQAQKKYELTRKARARAKKYAQSSKGKITMRVCKKRANL